MAEEAGLPDTAGRVREKVWGFRCIQPDPPGFSPWLCRVPEAAAVVIPEYRAGSRSSAPPVVTHKAITVVKLIKKSVDNRRRSVVLCTFCFRAYSLHGELLKRLFRATK